jgi:hypothetical protein
MRPRLVVTLFAIAFLIAPNVAGAVPTVTIREAGTGFLNQDTIIVASPGDTVNFEVVLDTDGLSFEGYSYDLEITLGTVSSITLTHANLSPLIPDLLGLPVIDELADTINNINQGTLSTGLSAGVYVIDGISVFIDAIPFDGIVVNAVLGPGGTFGLGGGVLAPTLFLPAALTIVPEPTTALLVGMGLAVLALGRRRRV